MLIYDVILDVGMTGCQQTAYVYRGDDRSKMLRITLLQNGKVYAVPSDLDVRLHAVKPDDSERSVQCGIRGGSVYCLPTAGMTDTQGTVRCQLQIRDHSGAVLFTPEFSVEVAATLPVPELPEGASQDVEYNLEVLSALSASEDGETLLFRGEPIGADAGKGIPFVTSLPAYDGSGMIVYCKTGLMTGLYACEDGVWKQISSGSMASMAPYLIDSAHYHENIAALDSVTAEKLDDWDAAAAASHTHANKTALDKLSVSGDMLWYDGKPVGIEVCSGRLPQGQSYAGRIVYFTNYDTAGLYVNDGASWVRLTDNFDLSKVDTLWEQKHTHENRTTLDKLTESDGKLLFDEAEIGGVNVVSTPNALPANAPDGSVAAAVGNGTFETPVPIPAQSGSETVSADIAGMNLVIGAPTYSLPAINVAIAAGSIGASGSIEFADGSSIGLSLMPVAADAADNAYTDAGITLDPDDVIVAQGVRKYAVVADWSEHALDLVDPDKIVQVDAGHIRIPVGAIYAFENLVAEDNKTLSAGWNVLVSTIDTSNYDTLQIEIENGVDVNDYLLLPTSDENVMTVGGMRAATFFAGVAVSRTDAPKGLYVKLGTWKRLALA